MSNDGRQYGSIYRAGLKECEARLEARDRYIDELKAENARLRETMEKLAAGPRRDSVTQSQMAQESLDGCQKASRQGRQYGAVDEVMSVLDWLEECAAMQDSYRSHEACNTVRRHIERGVPDAVPGQMTAFHEYVPPEDGDAGSYYVEGWNDCRQQVLDNLAAAPASEAVPDEITDSEDHRRKQLRVEVAERNDAIQNALASAPSQHEQGE